MSSPDAPSRMACWMARDSELGVDISETYLRVTPTSKVDEARSTVCGMNSSYIVAGARTPIGKMSGAFSTMSAAQLGSVAIAGALERAGVDPAEVDHVVMGQVLMAGQGQVPARQAAAGAGVPMGVPSVNVNKVCLSGLNAIYLAHQMIMKVSLRMTQWHVLGKVCVPCCVLEVLGMT